MPSPKLSLQTTTLWDYPSQHYGSGEQGSASYKGATPSWVIWNLLQRYTEPGQVVVDPMCGSGTTIDVCTDLDRVGVGFDLQPHHDEVSEADARDLPMDDESADFFFADPPYGRNLKYSGLDECIGELDARDQAYFDAMKEVFEEAWRVLKPGKCAAFYVCDVWSRDLMVPLGAHYVFMLNQIFEMVDHVSVVRGNKDLDKGNYHKAAEETNFYLRGFNHLIIVRKPEAGEDGVPGQPKKKRKPRSAGRGQEQAGRAPRKGSGGRADEFVEDEPTPKRPGGGRAGGGRPGGGRAGGNSGGRPGGKRPGGYKGGGSKGPRGGGGGRSGGRPGGRKSS